MSGLALFFSDPRQRNLVILFLLAMLSILAALVSLHEDEPPARQSAPAIFLPGFAQASQRATRIEIAARDAAFEIVFSPDKGWILPQRHSYPAAYEQVHRLLAALGSLEAVAAKTAQKDWLPHLGLDLSGGTRIRVKDEGGAVLTDIVFGKRERLDDGTGLTGVYVRQTGQSQSWLARARFVPSADPALWLDKSVPAIAIGRIMRVTLEPISGPSFTVSRAKPDAAFTMTALPKGRTLADPDAPNEIGTILSDFDFDDAIPLQEVSFEKAPRMMARTFDGLAVTIETTRMGAHYWAHVTAEGNSPASAKEAREIGGRTGAWAYRLPADKGQRLFMTLERMLAPKPDKK